MSNYVVIDLEMCKVPKANRWRYHHAMETIQIGAVLLDEGYREVSRFSTLVKPKYGAVDDYIHRLTGISRFDVSNAPGMVEAINSFLNWIPNEDTIMVSWSDADKIQLEQEKNAYNIEDSRLIRLLDNWIDCQRDFDDRFQYDNPCSLEEAIIATDIVTDGRAHDGLVDAINTSILFRKMKTEKDLMINNYYKQAKQGTSSKLTYSLGDLFAELGISNAITAN